MALGAVNSLLFRCTSHEQEEEEEEEEARSYSRDITKGYCPPPRDTRYSFAAVREMYLDVIYLDAPRAPSSSFEKNSLSFYSLVGLERGTKVRGD